MSHDHHHAHDHAITHVTQALVWGIVLNALFVLLEAYFGFVQHSLALLSDAGHNLSDVASLALAWLGFGLVKVKPTRSYTYGFKKSTILVALLNALVLLVGVGAIGYEAIQRLAHPQPIQGGSMAEIAAVGIGINFVTALLFFKDRNHDLNIKGAYLHMAADTLVSLGVVVAGLVILWTHWYWMDAAVSFAIIAVIVFSTWSLLRDSLRLSMDGVPPGISLDEVRSTAMTVPGVCDVHHIHVWAMSTMQNAMTAHVVVDAHMSVHDLEHIKMSLRHKLEHLNIQHCTFETESCEEGCRELACKDMEAAGHTQDH